MTNKQQILSINQKLFKLQSRFRIQYSLVNQAYFVMFGDRVSRIFNTAEEIIYFFNVDLGLTRACERNGV